MSELVTVAEAKEALLISGSGQDTLIEKLVKRSSGVVERFCKREFTLQEYTEFHDGKGVAGGHGTVFLHNYPIQKVHSLYDDPDREYGSAYLIQTTDYVVRNDEGIIQLDGLYLTKSYRNVKVTYTAGYDPIPEELKEAVLEVLACMFRRISDQRFGLSSISAADGTISFRDSEIPEEVKGTLLSFRKIPLGGF